MQGTLPTLSSKWSTRQWFGLEEEKFKIAQSSQDRGDHRQPDRWAWGRSTGDQLEPGALLEEECSHSGERTGCRCNELEMSANNV